MQYEIRLFKGRADIYIDKRYLLSGEKALSGDCIFSAVKAFNEILSHSKQCTHIEFRGSRAVNVLTLSAKDSELRLSVWDETGNEGAELFVITSDTVKAAAAFADALTPFAAGGELSRLYADDWGEFPQIDYERLKRALACSN